jgi:hypothetical protein
MTDDDRSDRFVWQLGDVVVLEEPTSSSTPSKDEIGYNSVNN